MRKKILDPITYFKKMVLVLKGKQPKFGQARNDGSNSAVGMTGRTVRTQSKMRQRCLREFGSLLAHILGSRGHPRFSSAFRCGRRY